MDASKPRAVRPGGTAAPPSELGFEEALERVEAIIEQVESGQIGLEDSIAQYEQGAALIVRCRKILDRAEQRVQELTAQMAAQTADQTADQTTGKDEAEAGDDGAGDRGPRA